MQYLLIPKLDTHWTGFQTNAASLPRPSHLAQPPTHAPARPFIQKGEGGE